MSNQGYALPSIEEVAIKNKKLTVQVTLYGSTTLGSITAVTTGSPGVAVWTQTSSATAPSDANFASLLSSATPTVLGIYITDGRAVRVNRAAVPVECILSASMTAGVVTLKGANVVTATNTTGPLKTGVTSAGNVAFQVSCTTLKLTDFANTHQFSVDVEYDVL